MRNVKKMLLGIASLILALGGFPISIWVLPVLGIIIFFVFLIIGLFFCIDGYLTPDE